MSGLVIHGGCHCGALTFALEWPHSNDSKLKIPARRCSCTFCTRFDGAWTSHPDANLEITEDPEHRATAYRFGTGTADFLFCSRCGISPVVVCEIDGRSYAVVNVNTFTETARDQIELNFSDTCFDGESTDSRLDRRQERWIGSVRRGQG